MGGESRIGRDPRAGGDAAVAGRHVSADDRRARSPGRRQGPGARPGGKDAMRSDEALSAGAAAVPARDRSRKQPGILGLSVARTVIELKQFFRQPQSAVFTFALPLLLLLLFGSIFSGTIKGPPGVKAVDFRQYFLAGMIASGVMSTCFNNLAITISLEQHEGLLKRLSLTPLPPAAYFAGKVASCLVISVIETVLMLLVATLLFGVS